MWYIGECMWWLSIRIIEQHLPDWRLIVNIVDSYTKLVMILPNLFNFVFLLVKLNRKRKFHYQSILMPQNKTAFWLIQTLDIITNQIFQFNKIIFEERGGNNYFTASSRDRATQFVFYMSSLFNKILIENQIDQYIGPFRPEKHTTELCSLASFFPLSLTRTRTLALSQSVTHMIKKAFYFFLTII